MLMTYVPISACGMLVYELLCLYHVVPKTGVGDGKQSIIQHFAIRCCLIRLFVCVGAYGGGSASTLLIGDRLFKSTTQREGETARQRQSEKEDEREE